jgi:hypothetical protein
MRTNRTPDEWVDWCLAKNRIDDELKKYYQACTTEQLPPRLLVVLKKLDEEIEPSAEHVHQ